MVSFEQAKVEIKNILDNVDLNQDYNPPAPPQDNSISKEMHAAVDGRWTPRTGYTNPIQQINSFDCSVHSVNQVIFAMLHQDLSETDMVATALNNGWLGYEGAGHDQLASTLKHFSNNKLSISWKNFSDVGFAGIKAILEDSQRDFIWHCGIDCSDGRYGHYALIRQSSWDLSLLSELRSICGAKQENIITESQFSNRTSFISQPSIGVVSYK